MARKTTGAGLFWVDEPKKETRRLPPERTWERPDYLPGLEEALAYAPELFTDNELIQACHDKEKLIFDTESYPSYWLAGFKSQTSGKIIYFELTEDNQILDIPKLKWILENFTIVNFNGLKYDFPVTAVALSGRPSEAMFEATDMLITQQLRSKEVYKKFKVQSLQLDQIDLIEITALAPGLKVCAGRLHAPRLQDLPFKPGSMLSKEQRAITRMYCLNTDLVNTGLLYEHLLPQIAIREEQGAQFGLDLRSQSDAQMAESIIASEVKRISGRKYLSRTELPSGTSYRYKTPKFIKFKSALLNWVLKTVENSVFVLNDKGAVIIPADLENRIIRIGKCQYQIGIGGLHSQEKSVAHVADENYFLADTDGNSYYPTLILNAGITPSNLGQDFSISYNGLVVKRLSAKAAGLSSIADGLKVPCNGVFGKLGSPWSIMYAPDLMIQVTITGQLAILMLVEAFELAGIEVTSVNTDGVVVKCLRSNEASFKQVVTQWGKDTGFTTEETRYAATYSRDINNYIAIYETPQKGKLFKLKGAYAATSSKKNAVNEICIDAVKAFLEKGTPPSETIRNCTDVRKFTTMRTVKGGAVKDGVFLGKLIRWFYSTEVVGEIVYAKSGNKVALSECARPCMDLPSQFPLDIDFLRYEDEAEKILMKIGFYGPVVGETVVEDEEVSEEEAEETPASLFD